MPETPNKLPDAGQSLPGEGLESEDLYAKLNPLVDAAWRKGKKCGLTSDEINGLFEQGQLSTNAERLVQQAERAEISAEQCVAEFRRVLELLFEQAAAGVDAESAYYEERLIKEARAHLRHRMETGYSAEVIPFYRYYEHAPGVFLKRPSSPARKRSSRSICARKCPSPSSPGCSMFTG